MYRSFVAHRLAVASSIALICMLPTTSVSLKLKPWPNYSTNQWYNPTLLPRPNFLPHFKDYNTAKQQSTYYGNPLSTSTGKSYDQYQSDLTGASSHGLREESTAHELSERYDYEDDFKKHEYSKVEHHDELKDVSYVYPVLLALLILGALFIPFISLFFFLAVSAFNCNGIGAGFGQVTPVFGRRRRRKRSAFDNSSSITRNQAGSLNNATSSSSSSLSSASSETMLDSITAHLPKMMLFDAYEASSDNLIHVELNDYAFWRKQLARNTVKLWDALSEFGAWINDHDEGG